MQQRMFAVGRDVFRAEALCRAGVSPDVRSGELHAEVLEEWCRDHLDGFMVPSEFLLVERLPRDPNGKILKRLLRDAAWTGQHRAI